MLKTIYGKAGIAAIALLAFALIPLAARAQGLKKVGEDCTISNPAEIWGDCDISEVALECLDSSNKKICVPAVEERTVGSFCTEVAHCDTREGFLKLTCDIDRRYCVGASRGVSCEDADVNATLGLGPVTAGTLSPVYRCGTSLFCDSKGECARDLGAEFVEEIGVGQSSEDIRDQIRQIINIALGFLGVVGVIIVIYGGALWMSAMGDDEKVEKGKKTIIAGLIGIVIIGIAWTIVSYVLNASQGLG